MVGLAIWIVSAAVVLWAAAIVVPIFLAIAMYILAIPYAIFKAILEPLLKGVFAGLLWFERHLSRLRGRCFSTLS